MSPVNPTVSKSLLGAGRHRSRRKSGRQDGLTLIELLVALVLGLVLILGVLGLFVANRETFRVTENLTRIQENVRAGFDFMARDIRETGQTPCGTNLVANVIRKGSPAAIPWWADWNAGTVIGIESSNDRTDIVAIGNTTNARVSGTDAILVIRADKNEQVITAHNTTDREITLKSVAGLAGDDVVLACDMQSAAIFQLGSVSTSLKVVSYDPSFAALNCTDKLGYPVPNACTGTLTTKVFSAGGRLSGLSASFWYVGNSANGKRSLYRTRLIKNTTAGVTTITTEPEEMVPGVQNLQMEYLTRDSATGTLASDWVAASDTAFDAASGGWTETNTQQVVAVRVTMTLQSEESVGTNQQPIQRQLIHVIGLRNRDALASGTP